MIKGCDDFHRFVPFRHAAVVAEDESEAIQTFFTYRHIKGKNIKKMTPRFEARYIATHNAQNSHVLGTF